MYLGLGLMRFELGYFSSLTNIINMVGVYFVFMISCIGGYIHALEYLFL
jgi:hypothetical protein